jgi:DNA polymerase-3 subunit gamma/tau
MAYVVTARKYRPQVFEELIGQEHIANTLKNAILKERVGHAYIFSGPRGIGKTSAARIFAKALNCENGPAPTPCNKCTFCTEITEGRSLDLVEIDGASNRRIDEIRQLRENVRFVPSAARFKIYIIDEVHMLTTEAFNALLKTLEEPPAHVIFIFATTEINKVPQTIRSRCQQFVFKRISIPEIVQMLKKVLTDVSMEAEEDALFWIAKSAVGAMRDAQSILDQMISYCEGIIKEEDVFYVLGIPSYDIYHEFARSIAEKNFNAAMSLLDKLIRDGMEISTLITGMIEYFRNLYILMADKETANLVDLPDQDIDTMKSFLTIFSKKDINNILVLLSKTYFDTKNSGLARELFEITLIKLVRYKDIIQPVSLIQRLEELKQKISGPGADEKKNSVLTGKSDKDSTTEGGENNISTITENNPDMIKQIISHFSKKRRAIAEFLTRAVNYNFNNNLLTVTYDQSERLSYEHVNEDSTKKFIEKEINKLLQLDIRVNFIINNDKNHGMQEPPITPEISKVIDIFKGEIIPNNNYGGS